MSEEIKVTICKGSVPGSRERFSIARLPIPGGQRKGKSDLVFASLRDVRFALRTAPSDALVDIAPDAAAELPEDIHQ